MKDRRKLSRKKKKGQKGQTILPQTEILEKALEYTETKDSHHQNGKENSTLGPDKEEEPSPAMVPPSPQAIQTKKIPWAHLFLSIFLAGLAFVIYSNTLHSPFVFDDRANISDNPSIRITELIPQSIADAASKSPISSRPLANISLALNYYFHQYRLPGYHIVNIAVHAATGILLYFLFLVTLRTPALKDAFKAPERLAFAATVIWLSHPLQTQSVTYIIQRMNSMATMFYLLAMLLYVTARLSDKKKIQYFLLGGCAVSAIAGFSSKEIVVTLPFFILLYEFYFFQDLDPAWLKSRFFIAPVILLAIALAFAYSRYLVGTDMVSGYEGRTFTLAQRLLTEPRVVIFYITLFFFPSPARLNLFHDFTISNSILHPASTLLSIMLIAALLSSAVYIARRERLVSFCILWYFGNLVLESSVIALEIIFEHRNYLPSTFLSLMVSYLAIRALGVWRGRVVKLILLGLIVAILSYWTYDRNRTWRDEKTLLVDCLEKAPYVARTQASLGYVLMWQWQLDEAMKRFQIALRLKPNKSVEAVIWENIYFIKKMKKSPNYHKNK